MKNFINLEQVISKNRLSNISVSIPLLETEEKKALIEKYHPSFDSALFSVIEFGKNKGEKAPLPLCEKLNAAFDTPSLDADAEALRLETDVLVIGSGGSGLSAAITAKEKGASVIVATKHTLSASNTAMAKGGISAAVGKDDSSKAHFKDTLSGGDNKANSVLVDKLTKEGLSAISWLSSIGVRFDSDQKGDFILHKGGGASKNRLLSVGDTTGKAIADALIEKAKALDIKLLENHLAKELILENGACRGALFEQKSGKSLKITAKAVILATGGMGALVCGGFPSSNHRGATGDGLVLGYKAGCRLLHICSLQYHPTGVAYPYSLLGSLVTEKARSLGAMLLNREGKPFINPLETRDTVTAAIIKECEKGLGIETEKGFAVFLDTPMIDIINGEGACQKELPSLYCRFLKNGIDITKQPILVYPTLHYQNGGIEIDENCRTATKNLFAAGEVTGGIHGHNRLMGNSLLDIIVFGIAAGNAAADSIK